MIAAIASLAGTGISAYGQIQAGKAAREAGKAAQANAAAANRQAADESRERMSRMRAMHQQKMGRLRASGGKSGIDIGSGSFEDLLEESSQRMELSVYDEHYRNTMDMRRRQYKGDLAAWEGRQQQTSQTLRGFGTLLTGVGRTAHQLHQAGMTGMSSGTA